MQHSRSNTLRLLLIATIIVCGIADSVVVGQSAGSCFSLSLVSDAHADDSEGGSTDSIKAGTPGIAFELPDLEGKKVSLKDFKGKTVLVNLWATWCTPCTAEMPALQRLYKAYKDKGLEIVAISADDKDSEENVKKFAKANGLTFTVLLDPDATVAAKYGVTGFPESFFIGPDGNFVSFSDPEIKENHVRIVSDRAWDSKVFLDAIGSLVGPAAAAPAVTGSATK